MRKIISARWKVSAWDLVKTVGMFFIATFGDLLWQWCDAWLMDNTVVMNLKLTLRTSIITTVGYFLKQWTSGGKTAGEIRPLVLIGMLFTIGGCYAIKPVPKNDTIRIPEGSKMAGINLLNNDIKGTLGTMVVTSIQYKTASYPFTVDKTINITGYGTVTITSAGILKASILPGVVKQFPEIRYMLNDGAIGNGKSADIVIIGTKIPLNAGIFHEGSYYRYISHPCVKVNNTYRSMIITGHMFYCGALDMDTSFGYYYSGAEYWIGDPRYTTYQAIKETGKFRLTINRSDWLYLYQNACIL